MNAEPEDLKKLSDDVRADAIAAGELAQRNIARFLELQKQQSAHLIMLAHERAAEAAAQTAGLAAKLAADSARSANELSRPHEKDG